MSEFIADVPLEVSPDVIDAPNYTEFAESSHFGKAVYGNARDSLTQVHALYSQIEITEHALINHNPGGPKVYVPNPQGYGPGSMITPNDKAHEYTRDLTKAYKGVLGRVNEKLSQMENVAGEFVQQIETVVKDPSAMSARSIALGAEIRAHMKSLRSADQHDQHMLMHDMIERGYKAGVAAILDAPPFLSGMTAEEQAEYKEMAQASWAPEAMNQLNMTRRLIGIVKHATEELHARYGLSYKKMSNEDITAVSRRLSELRGLA